ncbi:MAG: anhydro-N-acetylmuramic acid kinase [Pseudomonadota bacterium]
MAEYYIGLMSGTSMDALDAVLVEFNADTPRLLASLSAPFPAPLRAQLASLAQSGADEVARSAQADIALGRFSAETVQRLLGQAEIEATQIAAIGSHGQTIRHAPDTHPPYTVQIGDGNTLAQLTGITTVNDFRRRDMAAGGQGAPLVPAFHAAFLRRSDRHRVVLNLGGIANISNLPTDPGQPVTGFDTGPANTLMDAWCRHRFGEPYDRDGQRATAGKVDPALLKRLLQDPYFSRPPPKSTGPERFNLAWLEAQWDAPLADADLLATLCELTALTVAQAVAQHCPAAEEVILCGGGSYNRHLYRRLQAALPKQSLFTSEHFGVAPRWMEAVAFAWLARRTLHGLPGNLPAVTGARKAVILGAIHPA